jgi:ribosomal protein S12 methylthiotransferase
MIAKKKKKDEPGTAGIISLGCSKNLVDTEFIMGGLADEGYSFSPLFDEADLLVVNTCGFLQSSVAESTEAIEEALAWKRERGGGIVVVAGCLVNRSRRELEERFPEVDHFLPPGAIDALPSLLAGLRPPGKVEEAGRSYLPPEDAGRVLTSPDWAYLKISDGCDNRCSYCLIPGLRGGHRSRGGHEIVAEARSLIAAGAREINLVGQDITRWQGEEEESLPELIGDLAALPGQFRIRLLYLHPSRLDRELAETIAANEKVFPYLDLPIQHASDAVLAGMHRPYGMKDLEGLCDMLRRTIPGAALRTTVMVGFPGEGEKEFADLLGFLRAHPFENLGAFVFSPEKGTAAATMEGQVDPAVARERYGAVLELQQELAAGLWQRRIGTVTEALVLAGVEGDEGKLWGRTAWQAPEVDGGIVMAGTAGPGDLVSVKITAAGAYDLEGVIE